MFCHLHKRSLEWQQIRIFSTEQIVYNINHFQEKNSDIGVFQVQILTKPIAKGEIYQGAKFLFVFLYQLRVNAYGSTKKEAWWRAHRNLIQRHSQSSRYWRGWKKFLKNSLSLPSALKWKIMLKEKYLNKR